VLLVGALYTRDLIILQAWCCWSPPASC